MQLCAVIVGTYVRCLSQVKNDNPATCTLRLCERNGVLRGNSDIDLSHQRGETQCTRGILQVFGIGAHGCKEEELGIRREAIAK